MLPIIDAALFTHIRAERPVLFYKLKQTKVYIKAAFFGNFGINTVTPRDLDSQMLSNLVKVQGVIIKLSPKLVCESKKRAEKENNENSEETKEDVVYMDMRTALLQENPESIPSGQLPRSIPILLNDDLGESVRPGDKIVVCGIFLSSPFPQIDVFHITSATNSNLNSLIEVSAEKVKSYQDITLQDNLLQTFAECVAPSVRVPTIIKEGLLLQLLGGCRRKLKSGMTVRGDIHCLLVGDPSTGKSQLLRSIQKLKPQTVVTSGRGSSAAGLTAAVKTDKFTKTKTLEAGAVVMADKGMVCIDEFDKMSDKDRVALHEAMEQQTITIAKAGLHTTLNARCSVLAAANPIFGMYNKNMSIHKNLSLPDSLLSRFDILFLMLDKTDPVKDRDLATHVLSFRRGKTVETNFDVDFLRGYIEWAKDNVNPNLSPETREIIVDYYVRLRSDRRPKSLPTTPRLLETLIRLSTACARLHLRKVVEAKDCSNAFRIVCYSLYGFEDVRIAPATKKIVSTGKEHDLVGKKIFLRILSQLDDAAVFSISLSDMVVKVNILNKEEFNGTVPFTSVQVEKITLDFVAAGEVEYSNQMINV